MELTKGELLGYLDEMIALETESYILKRVWDFNESKRLSFEAVPEKPEPPSPPKRPSAPPPIPEPELKKYARADTFSKAFELFKEFITESAGGGVLAVAYFAVPIAPALFLSESLAGKAVVYLFLVAACYAVTFLVCAMVGAARELQVEVSLNRRYEEEYSAACRKHDEQERKNREGYERRCRELQENYKQQCQKVQERYNATNTHALAHNMLTQVVNRLIDGVQEETRPQREMLQATLTLFYDCGVVYPKYRNLVALTAFHEYLASGRCNSLAGAYGAYNKYEEEIRLDRIVDKLDAIIDKLDRIAATQHRLYVEMARANDSINALKMCVNERVDSLIEQSRANMGEVSALSANINRVNADMRGGFQEVNSYMANLNEVNKKAVAYLANIRQR